MIKIVKFKLVVDESRKTIAEYALEVNGFRIHGMRLIKRSNGKLVISFPFYRDDIGTHEWMYTVDTNLKKEIEEMVFGTYHSAIDKKISHKEDLSVGKVESLRSINIRLKNAVIPQRPSIKVHHSRYFVKKTA